MCHPASSGDEHIRRRPLPLKGMSVESQMLPLGTEAPDFALPDVVTGDTLKLADVGDAPGLLVMFICRHCPYVRHVRGRCS